VERVFGSCLVLDVVLGANGVDDESGRQIVSTGDLDVSSLTLCNKSASNKGEFGAFEQQTAAAANCVAKVRSNSAAAEKRG
jgi:hypothetical protein